MGKGTACISNQNFIQKFDLNEINFSLHAGVLNCITDTIVHASYMLFILARLPSVCLRIPSIILLASVPALSCRLGHVAYNRAFGTLMHGLASTQV